MEWKRLSISKPICPETGYGYEVLVRREEDKDDEWYEYFVATYCEEEPPEWRIHISVDGDRRRVDSSLSFGVSPNYDEWMPLPEPPKE